MEPAAEPTTEPAGEAGLVSAGTALDERIAQVRAEVQALEGRDLDLELDLAQLIGERAENWLMQQGQRDRAVAALLEQRELLRSILAAADTVLYAGPELSARLFLGLCCGQLYDLAGITEYGDEAIAALRAVVPLLVLWDTDDAAWFAWMLGELLFDRCSANTDGSELGRLRRLSEAASLADLAVRRCPEGDRELLADARVLQGMSAVQLWACDDTEADEASARAALRALLTEAVGDIPTEHPHRWGVSVDLADLCHEDYWTSEDAADLDLAIEHWAATQDGARQAGLEPAFVLGGYASALDTRYRARKDADPDAAVLDRERAVELFEAALVAVDDDDPVADWSAWCGSLYFDRFGCREDELDDDPPEPTVVADLDAAVRHLSLAVELGSPQLPWFDFVLRLCAAAQVQQMPLAEPPVDVIDRVIETARRALAVVADDGGRLGQTRILAAAMVHRYDTTTDPSSLVSALEILDAEYTVAPSDDDDRPQSAMALVKIASRAHPLGLISDATAERINRQLDEWSDQPQTGVPAGIRLTRLTRQLLSMSTSAATNDWRQPTAALRQFAKGMSPRRTQWRTAAGTALLVRFCDNGRVRDLSAATKHLRTHLERTPQGTIRYAEQAILLAYTSAVGLLRGWAPAGTSMVEAAAELNATVTAQMEVLPRDNPLRFMGATVMGMATAVAAGRNPTFEQSTQMLDLFRQLPMMSGIMAPFQRMMVALSVSADPRAGLADVAAAVTDIRKLIDEGAWTPRASMLPHGLALGLTHLYGRDHDPAHLREAVDLLHTVLGATAPGSWARIDTALQRAAALRLLAGHDRAYEQPSRAASIDALGGYAQLALIQSDPAEAAAVMRDAGLNAATAVAWCVSDRAWPDAVRAMESGRALTLGATMTLGTVTERLRAAGHHDLAVEWEAAEDEALEDIAPTDLPSRAVAALDPTATAAPEAAEIAAALRTLGQDALVYLVPGDLERFGYAVFVRPDGTITGTTLPKLVDVRGGDVHHFHRTYDAMRAAADETERSRLRRRWTAALDGLLPWAWSAAMEVVLSMLGGDAALPHITLVPVGQLSGVPWHAAHGRYPDRALGRPAYAIDRAVISYAASARILVDSAARQPMPLDSSALLIGNPAGADNLQWAEQEATALWRTFYPDADYFGAVADLGDGQPRDQTLRECSHADLLAGLPGGSRCRPVVHLSCHAGLPRGNRTGSILRARLVLGPGGLALSVARILRQAAGRPRDSPGPLVDLAGCNTHLAGQVHDEALTLSTAFLVAGAATVLGSQWRVMDRRTALLMFVVHHQLRRNALRPAEALRAAQLWMLDPARRPVDGMPPLLWDAAGSADLVQPRGWAAFVHQGR